MKCKDCSCCPEVVYQYGDDKAVRTYQCWGVSEPFEIKDIHVECTEYPEKNEDNLMQVNISFAKCCGNCMHASKPKKPDTHAAHYDVAKTERWCYLHNIYITRETVCDDFSWETKKGGVPACKRILKFNEKLLLLRKIQRKFKKLNLLNVEMKINNRFVMVCEGINYVPYGYHSGKYCGRLSCKDRETLEYLQCLMQIAEKGEI